MKITSLDLPTDVTALAERQAEIPEGADTTELAQGLLYWRNPLNLFTVVRLHRSADPAKRSQEWINKTKANLATSDYMREYELFWESLAGKPVYADDFGSHFHVSKSTLGWNPRLTVCRGWDFGLYPACVFAQLMPFSRLIVMREAIGIDITTERFIDEIARISGEWFPDASFCEFVDPTGRNRVGTDGRTYTGLLRGKPLNAKRLILGANAPAARKSAVVSFLKSNVKGLPSLVIDPACEYLVKGFEGGYLYAYNKGTLKPDPEKNIYSHIHDALQYLCTKVRSTDLSRIVGDSKPMVSEPRFGNRQPPTISANVIEEARKQGLHDGVISNRQVLSANFGKRVSADTIKQGAYGRR